MPLRLIMMGTGTFALPTFQALIESANEVVALVTQPDRVGRGHHHHPHPMKEAAVEAGIPVLQPERVNTPEVLEALKLFEPDLFVVAAYGQILSADLLNIPRLGAVNVHGSLLPKYRGAAPVQYAIWKGETETGITLFQLEPKLDAGPILGMIRTSIHPKETAGELHDRLATMAPPLTLEVLHGLEMGTIERRSQDSSQVTKAPRIRKEQGLIDWSKPTLAVECHIRAMQPWPMPFTFLELPEGAKDNTLRVLVLDVDPALDVGSDQLAKSRPGDLLPADHERLLVRTGDGAAEVTRIQPAGKRAMPAADFLHGHSVTGGHFGNGSDARGTIV